MEILEGTYNYFLVVISIAIAILASYITFDLISVTWNEKGKRNFQKWLVINSSVIGLGIWTMHFVGMLSFQLPIPVHYEVILTVISLFIAIIGSYVGFLIIHRRHEAIYLAFGSIVIGAGIVGMHYTGMHAMYLQADMHFEYSIVILSLLLAVSVPWVALRLFIKVNSEKISVTLQTRIIIACIMGVAISSMHYTGMAATSFTSNNRDLSQIQETMIGEGTLLAVIVFSFILLIFTAIFLVNLRLVLVSQLSQQLGLMRINEQQLRSMIENATDAFFIHDLQGKILDINKAAYEKLDYTREELLSAKVFDIEVGIDPEELKNKVWPSLEHGSSYHSLGKHRRKDGSVFPVDVNLTCFKDKDNKLVLALVHDITEAEELKASLQKLALTDELTNAPNRRSFMASLEKEVSRAQRTDNNLSLLMIDIDYFKKINDKHGHSVGDLALQHFVNEANKILRNEEIIGRIGGEEFAVLLADTNIKDAHSLADRLRSAIENSFLDIESTKIQFTISIGVASFSGKNMTSNNLLKKVDDALYKAKEKGRNRVERFSA